MAIDRRFADFAAHLATLAAYPRDAFVKHDRGALVSVDCHFADFDAHLAMLAGHQGTSASRTTEARPSPSKETWI